MSYPDVTLQRQCLSAMTLDDRNDKTEASSRTRRPQAFAARKMRILPLGDAGKVHPGLSIHPMTCIIIMRVVYTAPKWRRLNLDSAGSQPGKPTSIGMKSFEESSHEADFDKTLSQSS